MSKRELDLGRLMQKVGRRLEDEGQAASQHFYEWERTEPMPSADSSRGGGNGGVSFDERLREQREDRQASRLRSEWAKVRVQLEALAHRADWLLDQAKAETKPLDRHRTPAQVEADGFCGSCWKSTGKLVEVSIRSTGEPYYRGRCRFCGSWPGGDPPAEVLRERQRSGKDPMVRAS